MRGKLYFGSYLDQARLGWQVISLGGALGLGLCLAGCASTPPQTFDISSATPMARVQTRHQYIVAEPGAIQPFDTDRLVVRTGNDQVAYLSGAQWVDRLPKLLQERLITSLENAHLLRHISRVGLASDRNVIIDIRHFETDIQSAVARVELSVKLSDAQSGRIIAAKVFVATSPSPVHGAEAMAAAQNAATGVVLAQIVTWIGQAG